MDTCVLSFYPPTSCYRILIQFLESKFSFFAHISTFLCHDRTTNYETTYESEFWIF